MTFDEIGGLENLNTGVLVVAVKHSVWSFLDCTSRPEIRVLHIQVFQFGPLQRIDTWE